MPPHAQRGPVARLLFGVDGSRVQFESGQLHIDGSGQGQRIALARLTQPVLSQPGLLWSTLALETPDGAVALRGYRPRDLVALTAEVNEALAAEAVARLESRCAPLRDFLRELGARHGYVKDSQRAADAAKAAQLSGMRRDALWQYYATEEQRALYQRVAAFTAHSERITSEHNERFVAGQLEKYRDLFDTIESMPLTTAQRLACVRDEDNNLVLAGAGTGKTSTMIGRAAYLVASGAARPDQILMIAYARKAAEEMQERQDSRLKPLIGESSPQISTFHALGLKIVGQVEGAKPDVSVLATDRRALAAFITTAIEVNCDDPAYRAKLVRYLGTDRFLYRSPFDFGSREEYESYVTAQELVTLRGEAVKSFEELEIANALNRYSVKYVYEAPYEHATYDLEHRQYRPDFYLPDFGIYIEHFALDHQGNPPAHFRGYWEGVRWKRELHAERGTRLLETYSCQKRDGVLVSALLDQLLRAGVELHERSDEEMLRELNDTPAALEFAQFVGDFIALARDSGYDGEQLRNRSQFAVDPQRYGLVLDIVEPVLHAYVEDLHAKGEVDFAQMILAAAAYVEQGRYRPPYRHVLIDEFQDISGPRARLAKALHEQTPGSSLFAVGDDWQSIYRFTGSDVRFTSEFERRFGATATTRLDQTFRFNDKIGEVASAFVLRNPAQVPKEIRSSRRVAEPAISLGELSSDEQGLSATLAALAERVEANKGSGSVLVLSRFNFLLDAFGASFRREIRRKHPGLTVSYTTVHAAKGKEADYVVIIGLRKGKFGFPCLKSTDDALNALLPPAEDFRLAEERRLLYVALTRARERVYLLCDPKSRSEFVVELLQEHAGGVDLDELTPASGLARRTYVPCSSCATGVLVARESEDGKFYGCDNYPYCEHTEPGCPDCGSPMRRRAGGARICSNEECDRLVPYCPRCGAVMYLRPGRRGKFWGCGNYRRDDPNPCEGKVKVGLFPRTGREWGDSSLM